MKKRIGFVSNSSSSSFIIMFDKKPENANDIKEMLFGDNEIVSYYDYNISSNVASDIIFRDIEEFNEEVVINDLDNLIYSIRHYPKESWLIDEDDEDLKEFIKLDKIWDDWDKWKSMTEEEKQDFYKEQRKIKERILEKMMKNFKNESDGKYIYTVTFSDNDGDIYCTLEHGGVFDKVQHIRISNH